MSLVRLRTPFVQLHNHSDLLRSMASDNLCEEPLRLVGHLAAVGDMEVNLRVACVQHSPIKGMGVDAFDVREHRNALLTQ